MGYWSYRYTRPLDVRGGIKAQTKSGRFASSWWAQRWVHVLESFNVGARLSRGRSYARRGQVMDIRVRKGEVTAQVQGSRDKPYQVWIKVKKISRAKWDNLAQALSERALLTAGLLAGQMPENIEECFEQAGLSLFPSQRRDLKTDCSCPDWENPCKHIAAVYYLLGEEFDRDPFLIFKLRGMTREELMEKIGPPPDHRETVRKEKPTPLPAQPDKFWGKPPEEALSIGAEIPSVPAALPKRLGSFPFWRGESSFLSAIEAFYEEASPVGLDVFLGGEKPPPESEEG
jgi:uncharacterized Zn finger protein